MNRGRVQKIDPVEQTAGGLEFRENWLVQEQDWLNDWMTKSKSKTKTKQLDLFIHWDDPAGTEHWIGVVILCSDELIMTWWAWFAEGDQVWIIVEGRRTWKSGGGGTRKQADEQMWQVVGVFFLFHYTAFGTQTIASATQKWYLSLQILILHDAY